MQVRWTAALAACAWGLLLCGGAALAGEAGDKTVKKDGERLIKTVVIARHGVRAPTESREELREWTRRAWPQWPVQRGELTRRGSALVTALWAQERKALAGKGLLPARGCPGEGSVFVYADREQRTRDTAAALLKGLAPGCGLIGAVADKAGPDPLFHPLDVLAEGGQCRVDEAAAAREIRLAMRGRPDALVREFEAPLLSLARIVGPAPAAICQKYGLPEDCAAIDLPTELRVGPAGARLDGGLSIASRLVEILFLEYAEWPKQDAGWGAVDAETLEQLLPVHARVFDILHATPALAAAEGSALLDAVLGALTSGHAEKGINQARLVVFVGHDTNIAAVAGLLGLDWKLPTYAPGQIPPGSALMFDLWEKRDHSRVVRMRFMAQSPEALHSDPVSSQPPLETALRFAARERGNDAPAEELSLADFENRARHSLNKGCVPPPRKLVMRRKPL